MKKILMILLLISSFLLAKGDCDRQILEQIKGLSTREKVGQLFNIAIVGKSLSPEYRAFLTKYQIGGITLFNYNMRRKRQLKLFIQELQSVMKLKLFVSVDQEGGRITRYRLGDFFPPSPCFLGHINDLSVTEKVAAYTAQDLRAVGINLNLAPVVDILSNSKNHAIFDRSFGNKMSGVIAHSTKMIATYQKNGIIATAKHFPGQGSMAQDTHKTLPVSPLTKERLLKRELKPFIEAIKENVGIIMTSHVIFGGVDPKLPATLSKKFLKDILRDELGFKGVIFTDGLEMKAILDTFGLKRASVMALKNGADMITLNWDLKHIQIAIDAVIDAVKRGEITEKEIDQKLIRILTLKRRFLHQALGKGVVKSKVRQFLRELYRGGILWKNMTQSDRNNLKISEHIMTDIRALRNVPGIKYKRHLRGIKNSIIITKKHQRVHPSNITLFLGPAIWFKNNQKQKVVVLHDYNGYTLNLAKKLLNINRFR